MSSHMLPDDAANFELELPGRSSALAVGIRVGGNINPRAFYGDNSIQFQPEPNYSSR